MFPTERCNKENFDRTQQNITSTDNTLDTRCSKQILFLKKGRIVASSIAKRVPIYKSIQIKGNK